MEVKLRKDQKNAINSFIKSIEKLKRDAAMKNYPEYIKLCSTYQDVLRNMLERTNFVRFPDEGEVYVREHILPDGRKVEFAWDIPHLKKTKNTNEDIISRKFKLGLLADHIDFKGLEQSRFQYAISNTKPVYVIDYAPSNLLVLIDGNHRVASRLEFHRDPEKLISGILFPSEVHVEAMLSHFQKNFYKILANVGRIVVFLQTNVEGKEPSIPKLFEMGE